MMILSLYMYLFEKMLNTFYIATCNCNFEVSPCIRYGHVNSVTIPLFNDINVKFVQLKGLLIHSSL